MTSIKDIKKTGGRFKGPLLVKSSEEGVATNSKTYLSIVFQDLTGLLDAKKWEVVEGDLSTLVPGHVVLVEGDVFPYRGNMQMKVASVSKIDQNTIDLKDYITSSPLALEEMVQELERAIELIVNPEIKAITSELIHNNFERYTTYPAAMTYHHNYYGGILFHSISIVRLALKVADNYPFLSRDYLIAGALLHDLGKIVELSGNIGTSYTDEGKLLGHINIGASLIFETSRKLGIEGEVPLVLEHMVLSHHGKPEFGSPVAPRTAEAYVLHCLDDLDSHLNMLESVLNTVDEGEFSLKVVGMDNRQFYKVKK